MEQFIIRQASWHYRLLKFMPFVENRELLRKLNCYGGMISSCNYFMLVLMNLVSLMFAILVSYVGGFLLGFSLVYQPLTWWLVEDCKGAVPVGIYLLTSILTAIFMGILMLTVGEPSIIKNAVFLRIKIILNRLFCKFPTAFEIWEIIYNKICKPVVLEKKE